jgi:hypothetical protein
VVQENGWSGTLVRSSMFPYVSMFVWGVLQGQVYPYMLGIVDHDCNSLQINISLLFVVVLITITMIYIVYTMSNYLELVAHDLYSQCNWRFYHRVATMLTHSHFMLSYLSLDGWYIYWPCATLELLPYMNITSVMKIKCYMHQQMQGTNSFLLNSKNIIIREFHVA